MHKRGVRRAAVLVASAAIGVFGFAAAASAHVTVSPTSAPQGSYTIVTFRVPNEDPKGNTVELDVYLDTTHPVASVNVQPVPGWTAVVKQTKLATPIKDDDGNEVTSAAGEIVWTANSTADGIAPGQFNQFPVQMGPLPTTGSVSFKAVQTYSDGTVVRWIDQTVAGQPEPDHPAPVLTLTPTADSATAAAPAATAPAASTAAAATSTDGDAAAAPAKSDNTWGIIGVILGAVGVILGGAAYARGRSTPSSSE